MEEARFLYGPRPSKCCNAKTVLVQSRAGGFVSQDCSVCGNSGRISITELPKIPCDICGTELQASKDALSNYVYRCESCSRVRKLGDMLPRWSDYFPYSGLAAHGDEVFDSIVQAAKNL
jgi:hypothetical protein